MTNNTEPQTRKELRILLQGQNVRNALAFIIESLADCEVESAFDLKILDTETLHEFGEIWGFDNEGFTKAMRLFERAYYQEELANRDN